VYILNKNVNDDGPDALEEVVSALQAGLSAMPVVITAGPRQTAESLADYHGKVNYGGY
jgi:chemotaxis response regulator CheB